MGRETGLPISSSELSRRVTGRLRFELGEDRDRGEGHDDAGLHVEHSGAVDLAVGFAPGHGFEGADGPDGVEVAEEQDGFAAGARGAEAELEDVAEVFLVVALGAAAEGRGP